MIEALVSIVVVGVFFTLLSESVRHFRAGHRKAAWGFVVAIVLYIPALAVIGVIGESLL